MGDKRIEVAISNPPARSQQPQQQQQTQGGHPRGEAIFHGMMRAMKQRVDVPTGGEPDESSASEAKTEAREGAALAPEQQHSVPASASGTGTNASTRVAATALLPRAVAVATTSTNRLTNEAFRKLLAPKK